MLSRKYYEKFAKIIKESYHVNEIKTEMVKMFVADDPAFDEEKFLKAASKVPTITSVSRIPPKSKFDENYQQYINTHNQ